MDHLPKLIEDLALIMIVGAIVTLLFKKIKQPLVLGYIIAGFFVGPHLSLVPTVADTENIKTLAEIGVIFLLFSLGLEFNLKKLLHIGGASSITALVEIVFITLTGYMLGKFLGWTTMDSIFLGGMLASSSTTIIIKAFDDFGIKTRQFAHVVFGVLIVEDIVVILLLVLLPTISVAQQFAGVELLYIVLKLLLFLVMMFVSGIFILPTLMKQMRKFLNEETLLVLSVGLCLGMVVLATRIGFSAELGAFVMGFILAETSSAEKVEQVIKPVKDLFAAVFFVSIGMMIDPEIIIEYGWAVIAVTLLTIFGKLISTTAGAILSGQSLKQSIQVGMSMSQIGEFAFIVATLGLSLGVISEFLFPIAVGASAITTFTTPYMIKYSDKFYGFLERSLPKKWLDAVNNYSLSTQSIKSESRWKSVFKSYMFIVLSNSIIAFSLLFLLVEFLFPFLKEVFPHQVIFGVVSLIVSLGVISPFLWGIMAKRPSDIAYKEMWVNEKYNRGPLLILEIFRIIIGLLIIGFLVNTVFTTVVALLILVPFILVVLFIFSNQIKKFYQRLEDRFLNNLNTRKSHQDKEDASINAQKQLSQYLDQTPWNIHIIELEVGPHATFLGQTLESLSWREKFGINVAFIKRGEDLIYAPSRISTLFPFDKIGIIATDEQMLAFSAVFNEVDKINYVKHKIEDVGICAVQINEYNKLKGLSIKDSRIREYTNGMVIVIERNKQRILNPVSATVFEWGDIVWIAGERSKIQKLNQR